MGFVRRNFISDTYPLTDFCIWQPCRNPLRTVWLLSAPGDPSTRNRHFPVWVIDLAKFIHVS